MREMYDDEVVKRGRKTTCARGDTVIEGDRGVWYHMLLYRGT